MRIDRYGPSGESKRPSENQICQNLAFDTKPLFEALRKCPTSDKISGTVERDFCKYRVLIEIVQP